MKRIDPRAALSAVRRFLISHGWDIAYYACVALALTAIAFAAEHYRTARKGEVVSASLPTVDFAQPEAEDVAQSEEEALPQAPEGAKLLRPFTELPAWNEALGLWESHPAADYLLEDNSVNCLLAGTVRAVEYGGARGGFVEVESGGQILRYASIVPEEGLQIGDILEAGQPIGTTSDNMPGEAYLGPHLHLEWIVGGEAKDIAAPPLLASGGD